MYSCEYNKNLTNTQFVFILLNIVDYSYQLTNEQAQGFIAKRDFVNITARRYIDNTAILAAQACEYPRMPPKDK